MREQEIIGMLVDRDPRGVDALLAHYGPLMRYVIAPILPNMQDQEECLSEAAMRVWEKATLYDPAREAGPPGSPRSHEMPPSTSNVPGAA